MAKTGAFAVEVRLTCRALPVHPQEEAASTRWALKRCLSPRGAPRPGQKGIICFAEVSLDTVRLVTPLEIVPESFFAVSTHVQGILPAASVLEARKSLALGMALEATDPKQWIVRDIATASRKGNFVPVSGKGVRGLLGILGARVRGLTCSDSFQDSWNRKQRSHQYSALQQGSHHSNKIVSVQSAE